MSLLITGSLAYDHIMVFKDEFRNHILPEKVHMLNVAFNVDKLTREYGGTAGNIAYNLSLIGERPLILATVGSDFKPYCDRIRGWGLSTELILELNDEYTAQAFITTDLKDNQITAFHGGAMFRAHEQPLSVLKSSPDLVIVAPNGHQAMLAYTEHCRNRGWRFWFDPGQAMNTLEPEDLKACIVSAQGLIVNDYEWQMFRTKTGFSQEQVLEIIPVVLVTLGDQGVEIISRDGSQSVPAVTDVNDIDPTGAGDAFRAGLLFGLQSGFDLIPACTYACAMASFAVEVNGAQNHRFTMEEVVERKKQLV